MADADEAVEPSEERRDTALRLLHVLPRFGMMVEAIREYETPHGKVGFRQLAVLYALRYGMLPDDISPSQIADFYYIKPSVVTRVLAKLEENELIVRRPNLADGRSFHIAITDKGRKVSEYVEQLFVDWMLEGMAFLEDEELPELQRYLSVIDRFGENLEVARRRPRK